MKFTKEEARKELVAKMTTNGEKLNLSERSINEQLDTLMPLIANDETELDAFVTSCLPIFKTADANVRNDVSVGIKTWKENNPAPTNEPKPNPTPKDTHEPSELEQRILALEEENKRQKKELFSSSKKKELSSKLKEKGIKNEKWIESLLKEVNIGDDFDVDAKADSYLALYNTMQSEIPEGTTPKSPNGNKDEYTNDVIKQAAELAKSNNLVGY